MPIQTIYDRWISRYSALRAAQLTSPKYHLEGEGTPRPTATGVRHVHVVHIRTTPEKLWEALTRLEHTRLYYYGMDIASELRPGTPMEYISGRGGRVDEEAPILDGLKTYLETGRPQGFPRP